eukprot:CAMPEP_0172459312 /NCGR_PEP_ID=MMETSP1065-20121228/31993_1 /TAXON_ID=265537 /ORGANISM="Amphiprora paludosa, Strain CCMP125" /LENGTH=408 /DNA_ID=CAMNT_0013213943 /DNA_START=193 /DNA_END=1419 /DNA_ORIENTATION=-
MELARSELSRIVGYQNPNSWCIDRNESQLSQHRYYFLDRLGVNAHGDTSLHRLLALHASPEVVGHFITHLKEHRRLWGEVEQGVSRSLGRYTGLPEPPRIDQGNRKGVTALHVAVYRNSWHVEEVASVLIRECPKLTSLAMTPCGNYPLHIAAGHSITIRREVLEVLLKADGQVAWKEDCEGNNPLSLLWKNVLRFRWARQWEEEGVVPIAMKGDLSWMTVIAPCQFLDYSLSILERAYKRKNLDWNDVCGFPRCPPLLIKMLLQQPSCLRGSLLTPDTQNRYPLHRAAQSPAVNHSNVPTTIARRTTTLVDLILAMTEGEFAEVSDQTGRCPLHYACHDKPASTLESLIMAGPGALRVPDPLTRLYPSQQVATRRDLMCQMDITFQMLNSCPDILSYHKGPVAVGNL